MSVPMTASRRYIRGDAHSQSCGVGPTDAKPIHRSATARATMKEQRFESSVVSDGRLNDRAFIDETSSSHASPKDDASAQAANRRLICYSLEKSIAPILMAVCDGQVSLRREVLLAHAPGTTNPTTWVHCLAITRFGVFVIEHYHWTGAVKPTNNDDELLVVDDFGVATVQTSPFRRAKPAVRYLRTLLSQYGCPIESVAIFADSGCRLHPTLPDAVLKLPELYHFLRTRLNRFRATHSRYLELQAIVAQLDWRLHGARMGE